MQTTSTEVLKSYVFNEPILIAPARLQPIDPAAIFTVRLIFFFSLLYGVCSGDNLVLWNASALLSRRGLSDIRGSSGTWLLFLPLQDRGPLRLCGALQTVKAPTYTLLHSCPPCRLRVRRCGGVRGSHSGDA